MIPLPPQTSLAMAVTSRPTFPQVALHRLICPSVAYFLSNCIVVIIMWVSIISHRESILESFSWINWNFAIGRPNCFRSRQYFTAASYAPQAAPAAIHATPILEQVSAKLVSLKFEVSNLRLSGTNTSFMSIVTLLTIRKEYLFSILVVE